MCKLVLLHFLMRLCNCISRQTYFRIQEILFWCRPFSTIFFQFVINMYLLFVYKFHLNFVSSLFLFLFINNFRFIVSKETMDYFFIPKLSEEEESKLIKLNVFEEFEDKIYSVYFAKIQKWLDDYMQEQSIRKHTVFFLMSICSFMFWVAYDDFLTVFILGNALFIIPFLIFKRAKNCL